MTEIALRPYLPSDAAILAAIYAASIEELTQDEYTDGQRYAWMALAEDEQTFGRRLSESLTLVAMIDGEPVGFASLRDNQGIDWLYVSPTEIRQGVATALCDALEKLAAARGAQKLTVDSSDTAEPFFKQRGYILQSRNTRIIDDEWLGYMTMIKELAGPVAPGSVQ
jgi:putative acetyltransferase